MRPSASNNLTTRMPLHLVVTPFGISINCGIWLRPSALGFQTDGGARHEPIYEIGSPIFERVDINLGEQYGRGKRFTIIAKNTSRKNRYIQRAQLNGTLLDSWWFPASELLKGRQLELEMGPSPNPNWDAAAQPPVSD